MQKYKSEIISDNDIKIETDRYWSDEDIRVEAVKLTMISTGLEVCFHSIKGQLDAYNRALQNLEIKYQGGSCIDYNILIECTSCNQKVLCREEIINHEEVQRIAHFCKECDEEIEDIKKYYN